MQFTLFYRVENSFAKCKMRGTMPDLVVLILVSFSICHCLVVSIPFLLICLPALCCHWTWQPPAGVFFFHFDKYIVKLWSCNKELAKLKLSDTVISLKCT